MGGAASENMPTTEYAAADFEGDGKGLASIMTDTGLASSNSDAFRIISQGGVTVNDEKITDKKAVITTEMFKDGSILIRRGKKKYHKIVIK